MKNLYKLIFVAYIIIITAISTSPLKEPIAIGNDKFQHALAFTIFTVLFCLAFRNLNFIYPLICGTAYGIAIEIIQSFVPFRSADFNDVMANTVGLAVGIIIIYVIMAAVFKEKAGEAG